MTRTPAQIHWSHRRAKRFRPGGVSTSAPQQGPGTLRQGRSAVEELVEMVGLTADVQQVKHGWRIYFARTDGQKMFEAVRRLMWAERLVVCLSHGTSGLRVLGPELARVRWRGMLVEFWAVDSAEMGMTNGH